MHQCALLHVLRFLRTPHPHGHFRSLVDNVFVCAKPLEFAQSEAHLASSGKARPKRTKCPVLDCPAKFKLPEKLLLHLHEHPHLRQLTAEQWDEMMTYGADSHRLSLALAPAPAPLAATKKEEPADEKPVLIKRPRDE